MAKEKNTPKKVENKEVEQTSQTTTNTENLTEKQLSQETPIATVAKEKLPDIEQKIALLRRFPDAKVVILSDTEKGSLSNFLFSSLGVIDQARSEFKSVLNLKTEVLNSKDFYAGFAEYSESYEQLMKAIKDVEKHSINLLNQIKKPSAIRSGMLRGMIERNKKQNKKDAAVNQSAVEKKTEEKSA